MIDFPLVAALIASIAAYAVRLLEHRFDRIVTKERDEFEDRFKAGDSPTGKTIDEMLAEIEQELDSSGADSAKDARLHALEARLGELEKDREANHYDFAVQREYHALGLAQSKISFTLGYVFGAVGAVVILAGAVKLLFFSDSDSQVAVGIFTAIAGAIPEALAGLLFVSASRDGTRMTENFDRGRADRDLAAAQRIAAEMEDRELGNRLQAVIALSMARSDVTDTALRLVGGDGRSLTTTAEKETAGMGD